MKKSGAGKANRCDEYQRHEEIRGEAAPDDDSRIFLNPYTSVKDVPEDIGHREKDHGRGQHQAEDGDNLARDDVRNQQAGDEEREEREENRGGTTIHPFPWDASCFC